MTSVPKKIDTDAVGESAPASNGGPDSAEDERIRALLEEGLASGAAIPVDSDFFERLRARVSRRS
jgi:hypothetical protein